MWDKEDCSVDELKVLLVETWMKLPPQQKLFDSLPRCCHKVLRNKGWPNKILKCSNCDINEATIEYSNAFLSKYNQKLIAIMFNFYLFIFLGGGGCVDCLKSVL